MGCGQSNESVSKNNEGLRLMTSKLHFRPDQLEKLNDYFGHLVESDNEVSPDIARIEASVERLVQRLVVGVGNLDRRFAAMFLVSLNERRRIKQLRFEYLLRLDSLSRPSDGEQLPLSIEEDSALPGFARLRLRTGNAGEWAEFLGADARIRRDLIKARVAALLAAALKENSVDEADERLCMTPGQVVDAEVLDKILKQPRHCRVFYGPAGAESKLPEIGSHRVAIVEDESGIILKIGLDGSKTQDIQVRLIVGASVDSWPSSADYPKRIPLHHCDALLHYTAAQSGMYVVATSPHQGLRCEDRASLWRIRVPAAETIMSNYYSEESVPRQIESVLLQILDQLRGRRSLDFSVRRKGSVRLLSRHIARAAHWWSLERSGPDPLRNWAADTLSRHVLRTLDELLRALKCQNLRCYFQPRCNLMLQCARGGTLQQREDAYAADGRILESYLTSLHGYSLEWLENPKRKSQSSSELLERELLARWPRVMASLPRGTMSGHHGYGNHQLQYLGLVVGHVLRAKDSLNQESFDNSFFNLSMDLQAGESIENLVYLMTLVLKQAKEHQVQVTSSGNRRRKRKRRRSKSERKRSCARAYFDRSVDMLVDIVRKDRETAYLDLENDSVMAKTLLKWLYFGMEEDKKVLGPLLRPYLGNLFNGSHELAWHVESWCSRQEAYGAEMRSLGLFCKLVTAGEILPANGIVESLAKGWAWAESIARSIESSDSRNAGLKLVFLTPERILRYQLKFAGGKDKASCFSSWSKARSVAARRPSLARTSMITATNTLPILIRQSEPDDASNKGVAGHVELREASPLTFVAAMARRRGRQRAPGGLIPALVTLNKFRVLQEAAQVLPAQECTSMLELVQRVSRESARRFRRASCPDASSQVAAHRQLYTPRSESKLYEAPRERRESSETTREQNIILERQLQLRREISEIHDTLTRGLRSRSQLPAWDSSSLASSWTSSIGSLGHARLKKHRAPIWDTVRGTSALWDSVSCDSTFVKVKLKEDIPKQQQQQQQPQLEAMEQPNNKRKVENHESNKLPSWELLEKVLNKKCLSFEYIKSDSCEQENEDVNVDYLFISNDTKEIPIKTN